MKKYIWWIIAGAMVLIAVTVFITRITDVVPEVEPTLTSNISATHTPIQMPNPTPTANPLIAAPVMPNADVDADMDVDANVDLNMDVDLDVPGNAINVDSDLIQELTFEDATQRLSIFTGNHMTITVDKVCFYKSRTEVYVTANIAEGSTASFHSGPTPTLIVGDTPLAYDVYELMRRIDEFRIYEGVEKQYMFELEPADYENGDTLSFRCSIFSYPGQEVNIKLQ